MKRHNRHPYLLITDELTKDVNVKVRYTADILLEAKDDPYVLLA